MGISAKEIAQIVGVSRQAVYSVLGNKAVCHVAAEKREQILKLAKAHHYRPQHAAVRLNGISLRSIGVITDGFGGVVGRRLAALATGLHLDGYTMDVAYFVGIKQACDAIGNFISGGKDAVIFPGCVMAQLKCEDVSIPSVIDGFEVATDYAAGMAMMVRHLAIEHGHRNILMTATELFYGNTHKYAGYCRALQELGLPVFPAVSSIGNAGFGDEIMRHLDAGVTAIVTCGDVFAASLIHFLRLRGIRVPEDVAVTGFDGLGEHPGLTSVHDTVREYADAMRALLLRKIELGQLETGEPQLIAPALTIGTSCGCREEPNPVFAYAHAKEE